MSDEVSTGSGSDLGKADHKLDFVGRDPVATAPGTDSIAFRKLGHYPKC